MPAAVRPRDQLEPPDRFRFELIVKRMHKPISLSETKASQITPRTGMWDQNDAYADFTIRLVSSAYLSLRDVAACLSRPASCFA
ncbi:MAG: hypothetical protein C3F11_13950, partial [Methylocystaceae bacterium]